MGQGAVDERPVAAQLQRARRAVGHGQGAGVDVGRGVEEVGQGELNGAGKRAVVALVGRGDDAELGRQSFGPLPERRDDDAVDALAPGVPLGQRRLIQPVGQLQLVQRAAGQLTHLAQRRRDGGQNFGRQAAAQVAAQDAVVVILVAQPGGGLVEGLEVHGVLRL